jgi:hypothetical protein
MKLQVNELTETPQELKEVMVNLSKELIQYVKGQMGPNAVKRLGVLVNPEIMAMDLLEKFINALPPEYVKVKRYKGHERLLASGEYELLKPIPQAIVLETLQKAQILG